MFNFWRESVEINCQLLFTIFAISHQAIFGILTLGNTQHVWFCSSIYILYWIWRRDFPIHIQTGGGANNSFLWRSKTRRHKEPFCLPNFGELAKANLSPHKFFIPPDPTSYLIAHSYIFQVFPPPACSFPSFPEVSSFWVKTHQKLQPIGKFLFVRFISLYRVYFTENSGIIYAY